MAMLLLATLGFYSCSNEEELGHWELMILPKWKFQE